MAKTAIDIDRSLADRAAAILGTETLRATVDQALREVVERTARREALERLRNRPFTPDERELARGAWR